MFVCVCVCVCVRVCVCVWVCVCVREYACVCVSRTRARVSGQRYTEPVQTCARFLYAFWFLKMRFVRYVKESYHTHIERFKGACINTCSEDVGISAVHLYLEWVAAHKRARSVEDETRNARRNAKRNAEWSSQVPFQTAHLKRER